MYHQMYFHGWEWFWMVPMMLLLIGLFGAVVYAAVCLARKHSHQHRPLHQ